MVNKNNRHIPMIIGDFYIPVSIIDRVSRDKIREDIRDLNNTVNLLNLIHTYRTLNNDRMCIPFQVFREYLPREIIFGP